MNYTSRKKSRACIHEHSGSLQDLISTFESQLTTASIMTPWFQVDTIVAESNGAETKARAKVLMDQYEYSGIPMVWSDRVIGVFTRYDPSQNPCYAAARPEHFVKSDSSLIALIRHMRDFHKVVVGVGSPECPAGWLTYADFSKRPFRVILFTILAEVEYLVAQALDVAHPDDSWLDLLEGDNSVRDQATLRRRQKEAMHWDVTMPLTTFAEIGHLIDALAASTKALALLGESTDIVNRLKSIPDLRNRVAHVVKPIVAGPGQIGGVANQIDLMLGWIQSWSQCLSSAMIGEATVANRGPIAVSATPAY